MSQPLEQTQLLNSAALRLAVRDTYSAVAATPNAQHPFPVGRRFAESVGYFPDLLDSLPASPVDAFAGVSNVSVFAAIPEGATVLDLGCGAGLDSLIASRRVGPRGAVIGVDFSESMIARARCGAADCQATNVEFRIADAERLPLADASVDVAIINGIFNLNPDRTSLFAQLARVLRAGGSAFVAELILIERLPREQRACQTNWFK